MKLDKNVFKNFDTLCKKIESLEQKIIELEAELHQKNHTLKGSLARICDGDIPSSDCVLNEMAYQDLSPTEAFNKFSKADYNFFLLDVSKKGFYPPENIEESHSIELEFLEMRISELPSKKTPIFVISEDGTRSILACERLKELGFININNISGGHKFWPGHKTFKLKVAS